MCNYRSMDQLEPEVLAETWETYKAFGGQELRNALVLHYMPMVKYVANKIGATLPAMVDRDDLVSYGMFGLMDAIEKFDLDRGLKFETYGVTRVRGAIYDEIRALDWVPRSIRSKARNLESTRSELEELFGRPPTHPEVAEALEVSMDDYWVLAAEGSIATVHSFHQFSDDSGDQDLMVYDHGSNPEGIAQVGEMVELLGEAINNLDERSKMILALSYLQEMTLGQIGQVLGVTESRVCQLQSKVLQSLRESLELGRPAAA